MTSLGFDPGTGSAEPRPPCQRPSILVYVKSVAPFCQRHVGESFRSREIDCLARELQLNLPSLRAGCASGPKMTIMRTYETPRSNAGHPPPWLPVFGWAVPLSFSVRPNFLPELCH